MSFKRQIDFNLSAIPTHESTLSCLPDEILGEIIDYLPIHDHRMLSQTARILNPVIETSLYAKIQKCLGILTCDLLNDDRIKKGLESEYDRKVYTFFNEKINSFPNNSKEKCHALRESICSLFSAIDGELEFMSFPHSEDPFLLPTLLKVLANKEETCISYRKENAKNFISFFKMLDSGQFKKNNLVVNFHDDLDENELKLIATAIQKNSFITDLSINIRNRINPEFNRLVCNELSNAAVANKNINTIYFNAKLGSCTKLDDEIEAIIWKDFFMKIENGKVVSKFFLFL